MSPHTIHARREFAVLVTLHGCIACLRHHHRSSGSAPCIRTGNLLARTAAATLCGAVPRTPLHRPLRSAPSAAASSSSWPTATPRSLARCTRPARLPRPRVARSRHSCRRRTRASHSRSGGGEGPAAAGAGGGLHATCCDAGRAVNHCSYSACKATHFMCVPVPPPPGPAPVYASPNRTPSLARPTPAPATPSLSAHPQAGELSALRADCASRERAVASLEAQVVCQRTEAEHFRCGGGGRGRMCDV